MKNSDLRRMISEYGELKRRLDKRQDKFTVSRLKEIEQRYYHETGSDIRTKENK